MKYAILLIIAALLITSCSPAVSIPIETAEAQEQAPKEQIKDETKPPINPESTAVVYSMANLVLTSCIDSSNDGPLVASECSDKVLECWLKLPIEKQASPGSVISCAKKYFSGRP